MTVSAREKALAGLHARLAAALPAAIVTRLDSDARAQRAETMVLVRDGEMRSTQAIMSPLSYGCEWDAQLILSVRLSGSVPAARTKLDDLAQAVAAAIEADRTLAAAAEWAEPGAPSQAMQVEDASGATYAAIMPVTLHFTAAGSPAGPPA